MKAKINREKAKNECKASMLRSNFVCFMIKHAYFIDRDPIDLKYAVLFRPQFSFTSASEIHVFDDNFLFCNRHLAISFV